MVGQSRLLVGESRLLVGQSRLFGKLFFPRCSLHPSKKSKGALTDLPLQNRGQDWPPLIWNAQLPCTPGIKDGPLKLRIIPGVPRCCSEQGRKGSGRVDLGGRSLLGPKSTPARKNKYYLPSPFVVFCLEPGHATPFCRGVVRHTTCQLDHCPSISCRVNPRTWFAQGLLSDFCTKEINLPLGMGPQSLPERKRLLMFNPIIPSP